MTIPTIRLAGLGAFLGLSGSAAAQDEGPVPAVSLESRKPLILAGGVEERLLRNLPVRRTTSLSLTDLIPLRWAGCVELGDAEKK